MPEVLANQLVAGALGAAATSGAGTLTLATGHGAKFPATGTYRVLVYVPATGADAEVVTIASRAGDVLTVLARGQEGTAAVAHGLGDAVDLVLTAGGLEARLADLAPTTLAVPSQAGVPASVAVGRVSYRTGGTRGLHVDTGTTVFQAFGRLLNVREFGARADYVKRTDGAITTGTAILTSAGASFAATDVGKVAVVAGAGAAGVKLITTISAFTSATQVTLATNAGTTVSGAAFFYGTDDTAAFQAALDVASSATVLIPDGAYLLSTITIAANRRLQGAGLHGVYLIPYQDADCIRINTTSMQAANRAYNIHVGDFAIYPLLDMTAGAGIHVGNVGSARFENLKLSNPLGGKLFEGIRIDGLADSTFDNVWISLAVQDGVIYDPPIDGSSYVGRSVETFWTDGCKVNLCGRYGVYLRFAQTYGVGVGTNSGTLEGTHLQGVSFYANVAGALRVETTVAGAQIRNVHLDGAILDSTTAGPGLYVGGAGGQIENVVCDNIWASYNQGATSDGLYFGANVVDVAVSGGMVPLNGRDGIRVDGARRVNLAGVTLWNNSQQTTETGYAVTLTGDALEAVLAGIRAYNSGKASYLAQHGLYLGAGVQEVILGEDCVFDVGAATSTIRPINNLSKMYLKINARNFGVKGDARVITDPAMARTSATLTSAASAQFTANDVGKSIIVLYAGLNADGTVPAAGPHLKTTVTAVASATSATLAAAATSGVAAGPSRAHLATDDSQALNNIVAGLTVGLIYLPPGEYYFGSTIAIDKEISLLGAGEKETQIVGSWTSDTADTIALNAAGAAASRTYTMIYGGFQMLCRTVHTAGAAIKVGTVGLVTFRDIKCSDSYEGRFYDGMHITRGTDLILQNVSMTGCRHDGLRIANDSGFQIVEVNISQDCRFSRNWNHGIQITNAFSAAGSSTEGIVIGACSVFNNGTPAGADASPSGVRISTASGAVVRNIYMNGTILDSNYKAGFIAEGAGSCKALRVDNVWTSYNGNKNNGLIASYAVGAGGTGYTTVPTVTITGGGGQQATAYARINSSGVVTGVEVVDHGYGYTSTPAVAITGGGGTGATATSASPTLPSFHNMYVGASVTEWEVVGCTIMLAGLFGMYIDGPNRGRVQNNQIYDNSQNANAVSYGVLVNLSTTYLSLANNRIYNTNASYTSNKQNGLWLNAGGTGGTPTTPTDLEIVGNFLDTNAGNAGGTTPLLAVFPMTRVRWFGNVVDTTAENGASVIGGSLGLFTNVPTYGLHQIGGGHRLQALVAPAAPTLVVNAGTGTTYWWFVVAEDHSGGRALASAGASASTSATPNVTVKWAQVTGAKTYYVLRHTASTLPVGSNSTLVGTVTAPTQTAAPEFWFTDTNAAPSAFTTPTRNNTADIIVDGVGRFAGTAIQSSDTQRVFMSPLAHNSTFVLLTGVGYWVYLGQAQDDITPKFVEFLVTAVAAGAQTAEVGLFSTPGPPAKAAQSLTKLVSTATVDALTSTGVKRNTTQFATVVPVGTHLWAGLRTAMATTQPTVRGLWDDWSQGQILSLAASGVLTGAGPWSGALPAVNLTAAQVPALRVTMD